MSLAPYAVKVSDNVGRLYSEDTDITRSCYERDKSRIIHSASFRRLEYKTQVFANYEGDHYRTRLTHSIEVAQIAKSIARRMRCNEELSEVVALAHDLGHPPFGHAGERILNKLSALHGGFDHNVNTLKIITKLEKKYPEFDGLNLTWESLEGIVKHNGPVVHREENYITQFNQIYDLELASYSSLEAQIAAISDDIAYNNHDLEDGLRAKLFTLEDVLNIRFFAKIHDKIKARYPNIDNIRLICEIIRGAINIMICDIVDNSSIMLEQNNIETVSDVRNAGKQIIDFSPSMQEVHQEIRAFLMKNMYRHIHINRMIVRAENIITSLYNVFHEKPECLPAHYYQPIQSADERIKTVIITDYLAGMTDRYIIKQYNDLFGNIYQ